MKRIAAAIALLGIASPAIADHTTRHAPHRDELIAKCIREYGTAHSDRCVEIVSPRSVGRRAIYDYHHRRRIDCDDERVLNPISCSMGAEPRIRGEFR